MLYLDSHGLRGAARNGRKVTWLDKFGNSHDLDFVIEKGGTASKKGRPVAFIEVAWRRYTKHSRNKAQEIQGAILPIVEKHEWDTPFLGVIIAGVFTDGSIEQLESVGFQVLYIEYDSVVSAFASQGIDVKFDEETEDGVFERCIGKIEKMPQARLAKIKEHLVKANKGSIAEFSDALERALAKLIESIIIVSLYGSNTEFTDVSTAIAFIADFTPRNSPKDFKKFEIMVRYTNGDAINASFADKTKAISFLEYLRK